MCINNENIFVRTTNAWIMVGPDKTYFPKDEEFDEFFIDEEEYENNEEECSSVTFHNEDFINKLYAEGFFDDTEESDEEYEFDDIEELDGECEFDDASDAIFHCRVTGSECMSDIFGDGIPVFENGIHDHKIDERNAGIIRDMLRYADEPELVCLTLSLMTCSFYRWQAVNVGFVISNLKNAICEIYDIDKEEFDEAWGRGRMRELINSVSELIYYLRYKLIKCDDDEISHMLVNEKGGEFAYTLFANIFANKVLNPYDTNSFDYGNPRSVDYRSLVKRS